MNELSSQDKAFLRSLEHLLDDAKKVLDQTASIKVRLQEYSGMIKQSDYQSKLIRNGIEEAGYAIHYLTGLVGYIRPLVQMTGLDGPALREEYRK